MSASSVGELIVQIRSDPVRMRQALTEATVPIVVTASVPVERPTRSRPILRVVGR
ncbi:MULTISPECIES: hypothetical protein [Microbacterium]|uniref:hypothetical protein n=1 Tax=Microbacterium TaxID=33882 RepID=UPI0013B3C08A|nr:MULTISPECIES: hypothetical protein [Microbacterium]MCZ4066472.1 hypothetical protein [Microbacterium sp. H37-C3]